MRNRSPVMRRPVMRGFEVLVAALVPATLMMGARRAQGPCGVLPELDRRATDQSR